MLYNFVRSTKNKFILYCIFSSILTFINCTSSYSANEKPRIIILSDISGIAEPDDYQSFIRFLLYSNELEIEGIIGAGSIYGPGRGDNKYFHEVIDKYGSVRDNLLKNAAGYPSVDYLKSIVTIGQRGTAGMENVGNGKETPGSELIIKALQKDDPRPLWISIWGGTGTMAQALWDLKYNRGFSDKKIRGLISKIRIYDIAGQDNAGGWIAKTFPSIFYIRSTQQFLGMAEGHVALAQGGNLIVANSAWFKNNIMDQGAFGSIYPKRKFSYEGDTPAFMHLIRNGLSDPEMVHYGGWGGRFNKEKEKNPASRSNKVIESDFRDFYMYNDATDSWQFGDTTFNNVFSGLYRWREEYQNDFEARIKWTMLSKKAANHNPIAVVNEDKTKEIIRVRMAPGSQLQLQATDSFDPDGDQLSFQWFFYQEPGTYDKQVEISNPASTNPTVHIPSDAAKKEIHIILKLKDNGSPSLYAYRRVVISVK